MKIIWEGYVDRCWSVIFTLYLKKIRLISRGGIKYICYLCLKRYESLYRFIPNNFEDVDVVSKNDNKYSCVIRIEAHYGVAEEKPMVEDEKAYSGDEISE
jgi:hypothetical protein